MQTITYKQAAELLGVQYITIKQAVMRGSLTRCTSRTQYALLIKEQVEIFKGKSRISERALTLEERSTWEEYKTIAQNPAELEKHGNKTIDEALKDVEERLTIAAKVDSIMDICRKILIVLLDDIEDPHSKELEEATYPH